MRNNLSTMMDISAFCCVYFKNLNSFCTPVHWLWVDLVKIVQQDDKVACMFFSVLLFPQYYGQESNINLLMVWNINNEKQFVNNDGHICLLCVGTQTTEPNVVLVAVVWQSLFISLFSASHLLVVIFLIWI
jgi:hypothetical protein